MATQDASSHPILGKTPMSIKDAISGFGRTSPLRAIYEQGQ